MNATIEQLRSALEAHDWYYMMSDDHRAYCAGLKELDEIEKIQSELPLEDKAHGLDLIHAYRFKYRIEI